MYLLYPDFQSLVRHEKKEHAYDECLYNKIVEHEQKTDENKKNDDTPKSTIVDTVVEIAGAIIEAIITN